MYSSIHKLLLAPVAAAVVVLGLIAPASAAAPRVVAADPVEVPADIDVLSIGCRGVTRDGNQMAGCRWGQTDQARAYQLWRIVDRGHRELVGTYDNTTNVARDDVPDDAALVRYAVIALGVEGEIVGRSRVARVRFRATDDTTDRVTDRLTDRG
jgi:hypothetical protein